MKIDQSKVSKINGPQQSLIYVKHFILYTDCWDVLIFVCFFGCTFPLLFWANLDSNDFVFLNNIYSFTSSLSTIKSPHYSKSYISSLVSLIHYGVPIPSCTPNQPFICCCPRPRSSRTKKIRHQSTYKTDHRSLPIGQHVSPLQRYPSLPLHVRQLRCRVR